MALQAETMPLQVETMALQVETMPFQEVALDSVAIEIREDEQNTKALR